MAHAARQAFLVMLAILAVGVGAPEHARAQGTPQSTTEDVGHGLPACDCQHLDLLMRRMRTTARMAKAFALVAEVAIKCEQDRSQCGNLSRDQLKQKLNDFQRQRLMELVERHRVRELNEHNVRRHFLGGSGTSTGQALTEGQSQGGSPGPGRAPAGSDPNNALTGSDTPADRPSAGGPVGAIEYIPFGDGIRDPEITVVNGEIRPRNRTLSPDRIPNDFITERPEDGYIPHPDPAARERAYLAWQRAHAAGQRLCEWRNRAEAITLLRQRALSEQWCGDMARAVMEHERKHMAQCNAGHYWGYVHAAASEAAATEAEAYELETYKLQTRIMQILESKGHFTLAGSTTLTAQHPTGVYKFAITTQAATKQKLQYHPPEERIPPILRLEFQSPMEISIVRPVTQYGANCRLEAFPATLPQKTLHAIHLYKDEYLRFTGQLASGTLIYYLACPTPHGTIERHRIQPGLAVPWTGDDQELIRLDGNRIPIQDVHTSPGSQNFYFFTAQCRR